MRFYHRTLQCNRWFSHSTLVKNFFSTRVNILHNHLLDETEKTSSIVSDLKRKLDKIELQLARPPILVHRPMKKKHILARYEKLSKMGQTSVNNNTTAEAKHDQLRVPKKRELPACVSTKIKFESVNSKSKSKLSTSKKPKEKYSRNGIKKVSHSLILVSIVVNEL